LIIPKTTLCWLLDSQCKCCKLQETFTCNLWTQLLISVFFSVFVSMRWCMETSGILELFSDDYYKSTACFVITCWIIIKVGQNVARFEILTKTVIASSDFGQTFCCLSRSIKPFSTLGTSPTHKRLPQRSRLDRLRGG